MKLLRTIIGFLVVLLLFEGAARLMDPHLPAAVIWSNPFAQAKKTQLDDLHDQGGADVILIGSSITNASFDAGRLGEELDVTAYNAGLPSSNIPIWGRFMDDVVLDAACPGVVVIAVGSRDGNDLAPGISSSLRNWDDSLGVRLLTGDLTLLERIERRASDLSAFIRLRSRLRDPANTLRWLVNGAAPGWTSVTENIDEHGRYLGFATGEFGPEPQLQGLKDTTFAEFGAGGTQMDALRAIIDDTRATGAEVVIIDMPAMETVLSEAPPRGMKDINDFHAAVDDVATDMGVPLIRWNDMVDEERWFADLYHLNEAGTQEATRRLTEWLRTSGLVMDADCG